MHEMSYLEDRLKWLIKVRWIAILSALVLASFVRRQGYFDFSPAPVYGILAFSAVGNMALASSLHRLRAKLMAHALFQILLDQATLGILLYISGACLSPFLYFFLFHVVISGILLPYRYTTLVAGTAAVIPGITVLLSHENILPHYDIFNQSASRVVDVPAFLIHASAFFGTLVLTAYFVIYLNKRLHQSNSELKRTNQKLSSLVIASKPYAELAELDRVLSHSFRAILSMTGLEASIIIPDDEQERVRCYEYFSCTSDKCPAYHIEAPCWQLLGTLCSREDVRTANKDDQARCSHTCASQLPARTYDEKMNACSRCDHFARIVAASEGPLSLSRDCTPALSEKAAALNEREAAMLLAMKDGQQLLQGGQRSHRPAQPTGSDSLAFPLRMQDRVSGLLLLRGRSELVCTGDTLEYIRLLSEVTSTGLFGTNLFEYLETSYLQIVMSLANAVEAKDPYTRGHSERVAFYSIQIAMALGLTKQEKEHLSFSAILHDIGKIGTNSELLNKKDRLLAAEKEDMMAHALIGAKILEPVHFLKPIIAAVRHHHENYDGSGYPSAMQGAAIPLKARIVKIADAWDAMTSDRPYRKALSKSKAVQQLSRYAGSQFDPELVDIFIRTQDLQEGQP